LSATIKKKAFTAIKRFQPFVWPSSKSHKSS